MADGTEPSHFVFPRWANLLLPVAILGVLGVPPYLATVMVYGLSPRTIAVGYAPEQPVEYSHALHVGELGMDCRYCHTTVEGAAFAAIPPTQTCLNCHNDVTKLRWDAQTMLPVKKAAASEMPIPWVKVHDLPDYAYFNHAAHVNKGVGCVECHGRVDKMEVVHQVEDLSMGWCLDCHRAPERRLRPRDKVTVMDWGLDMTEEERLEVGEALAEEYGVRSPRQLTDCSVCHR